jgi:hypothetical protein
MPYVAPRPAFLGSACGLYYLAMHNDLGGRDQTSYPDADRSLRSEEHITFSMVRSFLPVRDLRPYITWSAVYAVLTCLTAAYFMADTVDYVTDVYNYELGIRYRLWEFGHLFWRPLGWILLRACEAVVGPTTGTDLRILVTRIFITLNWCAGFACMFLLRAILNRFISRPLVVACGVTALLFSNAFLNYVHSGSSYVPGLAFLLAGIYLLVFSLEKPSLQQPFWPACALAIAVCVWFPYIFALPGVLAIPLFLRNGDRSRWAFALCVTLYTLVLGLIFYGSVLAGTGMITVPAIYEWVTAESRRVGGVSGPTHVIFGFARSLINTGDDAVFFKRFLLHDPYNPVSFLDLLRMSLLKVILFYTLVILVLRQLIHHSRIMWICLLTAIPVFGFALFWHGGDSERYFPLYPVFFIGLACSLDDNRTPSYTKWVAGSFIVVSFLTNYGATSKLYLKRQQSHIEERVADLRPVLKPGSRLLLADIHDELENFGRSFPFNPVVREQTLHTYPVLNPGTVQTLHWRQDLASQVQKVWTSNDQIWVSKRMLESHPHHDWKWVEGADPRVNWSMLYDYFKQLDYGKSVGGGDGFLLLPHTRKNEIVIRSLQEGELQKSLNMP